MKYRIQDICREKGILMRDLAESLGRTPESLSRSLNNGTTTKVLEDIANELDVEVFELFEGYIPNKDKDGIVGFLKIEDKVYEINNFADIENILKLKR